MSKLKTDPAGYAIDCLNKMLDVLEPTSKPCVFATGTGGFACFISCMISSNYIPIGAAILGVFDAAGACVSNSFETEAVKIRNLIEILETLRENQSSSVLETLSFLEEFQKKTATCGTSSVNLKDILLTIRMAHQRPIENSDASLAENPMYRESSRFRIWTRQPDASAPLAEAVYSPVFDDASRQGPAAQK